MAVSALAGLGWFQVGARQSGPTPGAAPSTALPADAGGGGGDRSGLFRGRGMVGGELESGRKGRL